MAIKHHLSIDIPETANKYTLIIKDASIYGVNLPIECRRLDIYVPGFTIPVYITEQSDEPFFKNFSAKDLELQPLNNTDLYPLPDGVYKIKYSTAPNEVVFVEYYHLRATQLLEKYYKMLCKVQLDSYEPNASQHEKLHELREIRMYIEAAKAKTEYCHAPEKGIQLLTAAKKLLEKFETGCYSTC